MPLAITTEKDWSSTTLLQGKDIFILPPQG
jgi:hypothetical protein